MGIIYDMEWAKEIGKVMQKETNHLLSQFQHKDIFHVVEQAIKEMC
jgi:hypothetical protein